jgi:hypothetical protein
MLEFGAIFFYCLTLLIMSTLRFLSYELRLRVSVRQGGRLPLPLSALHVRGEV